MHKIQYKPSRRVLVVARKPLLILVTSTVFQKVSQAGSEHMRADINMAIGAIEIESQLPCEGQECDAIAASPSILRRAILYTI